MDHYIRPYFHKKNTHSIIQIVVLLYITMIPNACKNNTVKQQMQEKTITVSIGPLKLLAEKIAGREYKVHTLVSGSGNPETYEPSPTQIATVSHSQICFMIGNLGFEHAWGRKLQDNAPYTKFVYTSERIQHKSNEKHRNNDPHVWTSPQNLQEIAQAMYTALCSIDSSNKEQFTINLNAVLIDLQNLENNLHSLLDSSQNRTFLIYHPSLTYFANEYGLEQIAIEHQGKEPSPKLLAQTIEMCRAKGTTVCFVQRQFSQNNVQVVAKAIGARIITINPLAEDIGAELTRIAHIISNK